MEPEIKRKEETKEMKRKFEGEKRECFTKTVKTQEKVKNGISELIFILDKSGSMEGLREDTVGGFNSMLTEQKEKKGEARVTTVLFNERMQILHDRADIKEVKKMGKSDYIPSGCTALFDAVGQTIDRTDLIYRHIRTEDVPENTVVVIITDGLENSSEKYCAEEVRQMIREKTAEGWEFMFLGANIDAVLAAGVIGISEERAVTYYPDSEGTKINYEAVSNAVCEIRSNKKMSGLWKREVEKYRNQNLRKSL